MLQYVTSVSVTVYQSCQCCMLLQAVIIRHSIKIVTSSSVTLHYYLLHLSVLQFVTSVSVTICYICQCYNLLQSVTVIMTILICYNLLE